MDEDQVRSARHARSGNDGGWSHRRACDIFGDRVRGHDLEVCPRSVEARRDTRNLAMATLRRIPCPPPSELHGSTSSPGAPALRGPLNPPTQNTEEIGSGSGVLCRDTVQIGRLGMQDGVNPLLGRLDLCLHAGVFGKQIKQISAVEQFQRFTLGEFERRLAVATGRHQDSL